MRKIVSAKFLTYGGKTVVVDFPSSYPLFKSDYHTRERLADIMSAKTQKASDPIVSCTKLIYK